MLAGEGRGRGRVLAIDAGERRIGLALSDELRLLASPAGVLRRGPAGLAPVVQQIAELARREGVSLVVVGLPLHQDGTPGRQARRARAFANILARGLARPVELWDERQSTQAAEALVRAQGRSTRSLRQRGEMDAIAAAVILQDYLDAHARPPVPPAVVDRLG